jgi:hypothetical protein
MEIHVRRLQIKIYELLEICCLEIIIIGEVMFHIQLDIIHRFLLICVNYLGGNVGGDLNDHVQMIIACQISLTGKAWFLSGIRLKMMFDEHLLVNYVCH